MRESFAYFWRPGVAHFHITFGGGPERISGLRQGWAKRCRGWHEYIHCEKRVVGVFLPPWKAEGVIRTRGGHGSGNGSTRSMFGKSGLECLAER
eukprot:2570986-Prymnesium_polylepis.1